MAAVGGLYSIEEKFKQVGISARCDAAREDFTSILVRSRDSSAPLIALRDEVYKIAITHGLATVKWVPFSSTGFHPWNRSRAGISPSNVTQKLVDFHAAGVSTTEMLRAASWQRVPGANGDAHEATNQLVIARRMANLLQSLIRAWRNVRSRAATQFRPFGRRCRSWR